LTVNNVAPTLTATGAATATSGSSYTLNLSASDPGDDTIGGWTINWGDGTIDTVAGNPPSVTHTYTNLGFTNNILASATDEDGTFLQNDLVVGSLVVNSEFRFAANTGSDSTFGTSGDGLDDPAMAIVGPDGNFYVTSSGSNDVLRYAQNGTFIDVFTSGGSLNTPVALTFGADGNLYVASINTDEVQRFDGTTGAFIDVFNAGGSGLDGPTGLTFGADGNLYVSSWNNGGVYRFDGTTGAFIDAFVTPGAGGLNQPEQLVFGPDGHLYVADRQGDDVKRYDGISGAFIDSFTSGGTLDGTTGIAFAPDGYLYVSSRNTDAVLRYDATTGIHFDDFVPSGTGGLDQPHFNSFVPGHQVTVTPNTPPTVDLDANDSSGATGNDYSFTFTEGDGPTAIADTDTDLVDVDSTTFDHVTVSVSGLLDGNAEVLVLDGDTFALATAVAGQDTTGGNYHVVIGTGAGTATVTITKQGGGTFNETETETLIKAIQYQHTDTSTPTDGDRLIDVIVNDGTDDSTAARTTINVNPVNDAPVQTVPGTQTIPEET
ncbi:MAG: NHL repeat-containing protein, partial [Nitrospirota bacterium]|nr:NHL repeat-containing protein [Nitrospirota bacterium]